MRRAILLMWLTVLWIVLWRDLSLANVVSGLIVALVVTLLDPLAPPGDGREHTVRLVPLLVFLGFFVRELLEANVVVARAILAPRSRVRTGIVAVPLPACSDLVTTLVANAITLTPGTMTLEVRDDPRTLYVHVLHVEDVETVRQDIHKMLRLALRAFGSKEALANLTRIEAERHAAAPPDPEETP